MYRHSLLLCAFILACGPRQGDTGPEGVLPDDDGDVCQDDSDCGAGEICEADACEDGDRDNSVEEADTLLWEDTVEGVINPAGDVDWYAVQAEGGEFVRISVVTDEFEDGLDSVVSVYTESGKRLVWEDEHPAGEVSSADSMCFAYFPEAGTYYIKVEDLGSFNGGSGIGGPDETYTITVSEWQSVGVEPDSAMEAGLDYEELSANILYSFPVLLSDAGESDWAALSLPDPGSPIYVVALEHGEESDLVPRVTVRNASGDDVLDITSPTQDEPGMLPNAEGTDYVIGVTDASAGGGSDYWTWIFFLIRDTGYGNTPETEPNDDPATAEVMDLEDQEPDSGDWYQAYRQGRISSSTDVDVYPFDLPFEDAYINVYLGAQQYGGFLVTRLEVLDADGVTLDTVEAVTGEDENAVNLGPYAAGSYSLRISSADPEAPGGEGWFYLFGFNATSSRM